EINQVTGAPLVYTNQDFTPLLDFMGVSEISSSGAPFEWEPRANFMPMVTIGQKPVLVDEPSAMAAFAQKSMDFRKVALLAAGLSNQVSAAAQPDARIISTNFSNQRISIQTETPSPSLLVVAQTYYPAWKAYVDGKPTPLWKANYAFQSLQVPSGRHTVELRYEDNLFRAGIVLSGCGLAACIALWVIPGRQKGRTQESASTVC
ncbi:MAG TPA: YfhO family protein, partial [Verrucomicrobiae bacterium]|nr:YfhO family protein [Verrucomicrobiae bacterium]